MTAIPELCAKSATALAATVRAGEASAREVVESHIARIEAVNPTINALVIPLFDDARRRAESADAARLRGDALGPLHGVPFTVKECFFVAGTRATAGVAALGAAPSAADGPLVAALRRAGAILLGKTNLPQMIMGAEADNPIYGRSRNPWNLDRTPGGSSGGEAALLAARGTPLGLGTDLGGSVRTPAHFSGVCGFKPTAGRLTLRGTVDERIFGNLVGISEQPGPMAREVGDLALALGILARESERELPPVPALGEMAAVRLEGLRIGYYEDDGHFTPPPAMRRAVREAARALADAGCHVEPFAVPAMGEAMRIYAGLISTDGGAAWREILGQSPRTANVSGFVEAMRIPRFVKGPMARFAERTGQKRLADAMGAPSPRSRREYQEVVAARDAYAARFEAAMVGQKLDALLAPPFGLPALPHGTDVYIAPAMSYAALFNLLGYPAGVVPTTHIGRGEESDRRLGVDAVELMARRIEHGSAGLPVGVQVAARPFREDVALAVMAVLEAHAVATKALRLPQMAADARAPASA